MNLLDKYRSAGVLTFTVRNNEAIADNPYDGLEEFMPDEKGDLYDTELASVDFDNLNLPPLPTSGIPDGTVKIEEVAEEYRFWHDEYNDWYKVTEKQFYGILKEFPEQKNQIALVLKKPETVVLITHYWVHNNEAEPGQSIDGTFYPIGKKIHTDLKGGVYSIEEVEEQEQWYCGMRHTWIPCCEADFLNHAMKQVALIPKALRKGEEERKETCSCGYRHYGCECDDVCEDCGDKIIKTDYPDVTQPEKMEQTAEGIDVKAFLVKRLKMTVFQAEDLYQDYILATQEYAESQLAQYKEKLIGELSGARAKEGLHSEMGLDIAIDLIKNS